MGRSRKPFCSASTIATSRRARSCPLTTLSHLASGCDDAAVGRNGVARFCRSAHPGCACGQSPSAAYDRSRSGDPNGR